MERQVTTGYGSLQTRTRSPGGRWFPENPQERTRFIFGAGWMVIFSLLIFIAPLVNGLIGGWVGGYRLGALRRALGAAITAAPFLIAGLWLILIVFQMPILGLYVGVGPDLAIALSLAGLLLGALAGGLLAQVRARRRVSA